MFRQQDHGRPHALRRPAVPGDGGLGGLLRKGVLGPVLRHGGRNPRHRPGGDAQGCRRLRLQGGRRRCGASARLRDRRQRRGFRGEGRSHRLRDPLRMVLPGRGKARLSLHVGRVDYTDRASLCTAGRVRDQHDGLSGRLPELFRQLVADGPGNPHRLDSAGPGRGNGRRISDVHRPGRPDGGQYDHRPQRERHGGAFRAFDQQAGRGQRRYAGLQRDRVRGGHGGCLRDDSHSGGPHGGPDDHATQPYRPGAARLGGERSHSQLGGDVDRRPVEPLHADHQRQ